MNLIRSTLMYGRRSLALCLVLFTALWLGVSSWDTYKEAMARAQAVLERDGEALENAVSHEDEAAVKRILWSLGNDPVKALVFLPKNATTSPVLGSIGVGDLSSASFWLVSSSLPVVVNGLTLGSVVLKVDVLSVVSAAFSENIVLFLLVSFFSGGLLIAANMGSVRALSELERALLMLAQRLEKGEEAGLVELETLLSSTNRAGTLHDKLLAVVNGVVKAATQMTVLKAEKDREAAVARMMQMLAHDVRRPFSILRMGLPRLQKAQNPQQVKDVLGKLMPEVDKAVTSVNGLIQDVMEAGSTTTNLTQEPNSPESLIENSLGEVLRVYPKASVVLDYTFNHQHMVSVDSAKVSRVLSNIIANGVQAMNSTGRMWFATSEKDGFVTFTVANEGSFIEEKNLTKLFSAFYTAKRGGTGLGLAIAEKICRAHGGSIWCTSVKNEQYPSGMVAFHFTLPIDPSHISKTTAKLANHSSKIIETFAALMAGTDEQSGNLSVGKGELSFEEDIIEAAKVKGRKLSIMIVDDEEVYKSSLQESLLRTPDLAGAINIVQAANSTEALNAAASQSFDLIISDVDMGPVSLDGFELVEELRRLYGNTSRVCIHSNRIIDADFKASVACGANAFLPKPMAREQLLKLALQAVRADSTAATSIGPEQRNLAPTIVSAAAVSVSRPEVAVIEDNIFVLEFWAEVLGKDAKVYALESPEKLLEKINSDPGFLDRLSCLITDYHFDESQDNGLDVGKMVKARRSDLVVLLSSDGDYDAAGSAGYIDRKISKDPVRFAELPIIMN